MAVVRHQDADVDNRWMVPDARPDPSAIYVVDIETTGLRGCPTDKVVEIGIARVTWNAHDPYLGMVCGIWSSLISYPGETLPSDAWIFTHEGASLTPEDVQCEGMPYQAVIDVVRGILDGNRVTSYNRPFDIDLFLAREPWYVRALDAPDIMRAAAMVPGIPCGTWSGCPTCECAYNMLRPDDPAHIGGHEEHRALSDARVAGYIMLELIHRGFYFTGETRQVLKRRRTFGTP